MAIDHLDQNTMSLFGDGIDHSLDFFGDSKVTSTTKTVRKLDRHSAAKVAKLQLVKDKGLCRKEHLRAKKPSYFPTAKFVAKKHGEVSILDLHQDWVFEVLHKLADTPIKHRMSDFYPKFVEGFFAGKGGTLSSRRKNLSPMIGPRSVGDMEDGSYSKASMAWIRPSVIQLCKDIVSDWYVEHENEPRLERTLLLLDWRLKNMVNGDDPWIIGMRFCELQAEENMLDNERLSKCSLRIIGKKQAVADKGVTHWSNRFLPVEAEDDTEFDMNSVLDEMFSDTALYGVKHSESEEDEEETPSVEATPTESNDEVVDVYADEIDAVEETVISDEALKAAEKEELLDDDDFYSDDDSADFDFDNCVDSDYVTY